MPERAIVNYGIYVFEPEDRQCFRCRLTTQVERIPGNLSSNFKLQKPRSFYGYAQLMWGKWVVETKAIEYETQLLFDFVNDLGQLAILEYCHAQQTRDNIIALSGCIPGCVLQPGEQQIAGLWRFAYDRVVFKLFNDTTLLVNTDRQEFYNPCNVPLIFGDESYTPPEPSETDVPENPLDPGYDIPTAPYDPPSSDFGETYNPQRGEPPLGEESRPYRIRGSVRRVVNFETGTTTVDSFDFTAPGPIYGGNKRDVLTELGNGFRDLRIFIEIRADTPQRTGEAHFANYQGPLTDAQVNLLVNGYEILEFTVTPQ